ncbi:plasmid recombination protein, partial [Bacillus pumilus]|uniref:plasmid recombination protein n=1 Tax=Bacillus pumilus TaxID=1408 RepID=UPI003704B247
MSPTPQFFQNLSPHTETQFFKSNLQFIHHPYPKHNLIYPSLHNHQTTPHMHLPLLPITN